MAEILGLLLVMAVTAIVIGIVGSLIAKAVRFFFRRVIVYDNQTGLLYRDGKFEREVGAGAYWISALTDTIVIFDRRRTTAVVSGQEVLSADQLTIKASVLVEHTLADPVKARTVVQDYSDELRHAVQIALRDSISRRTAEEVLAARADLGPEMLPAVAEAAARFGVTVHAIHARDITLPGDVKRLLGEVARAKKQGQAALEKARGEQAALRSLANAARLVEGNPALLNLRILQSLESGQHTVVLGVPGAGVVPLKPGGGQPAPPPVEEGE